MLCARCESYVPSGARNIEIMRRYLRPGEQVICSRCLNEDSNYIKEYGRLPGRG
jgi:hypothetical protein